MRTGSGLDHDALPALAEARERLSSAAPADILGWAADTYGDGLCVTSSFTDAVLIDMASRVRPGIDVLFVDTGYHFAETLQTRAAVAERYPVRIVSTEVGMEAGVGEAELFRTDPDRCCRLNKVAPFDAALSPYRAWVSGIRRDETTARRAVGVVEWDEAHSMVKVNPLAGWTQEDVDAYIAEHDVLVNPLVSRGYPSIGCAPCTGPASAAGGLRSGRWPGFDKTECGLHVRLESVRASFGQESDAFGPL